MKYKVIYEQEAIVTYEAIVEAESEEEAQNKIKTLDIITEQRIKEDGLSVNILKVNKLKEQ